MTLSTLGNSFACSISFAEVIVSAFFENRAGGALTISGVSVDVVVLGDLGEEFAFEKIDSDIVLGMFDTVGNAVGGKTKGGDGLLTLCICSRRRLGEALSEERDRFRYCMHALDMRAHFRRDKRKDMIEEGRREV